jgi:membrane protein YqaA with SNARE-associated domain
MKRKNKFFWVFFILALLSLISIISLNYDAINFFIEENIHNYGYPAVFIVSFICDMIDQPILPEIPLVIAVSYGLNPFYVFLIGSLGISLIGLINFNIGRKFFRKKIGEICTTKKYFNYCKLFNKYGKICLLFSALSPLPYVTFVWLSGAFNMRFRDFFVLGMLVKTLRLGFFILLGFYVF